VSKLHKRSNDINLVFVASRCFDYSVKSCNNIAFIVQLILLLVDLHRVAR
jgi:hypothetical protein